MLSRRNTKKIQERRLFAFKRELALWTQGYEIIDPNALPNESEQRGRLEGPVDLTET
jgi:hypothetical protein